MPTIGSLFSGIGGLELGLERAGLGSTIWQVEINPYCRAVLKRHWPQARLYDDIRNTNRSCLATVDTICGGFPCQDLSSASARCDRPGLAGAKSGLWTEYRRVIDDLRPRNVVIENVGSSAKQLYLSTVRRDLHLLGYGSVAICISAAQVGALHKRARIFIVAHPYVEVKSTGAEYAETRILCENANVVWNEWPAEPSHIRVANGIPARMDRNRGLGNAVCPYVSQSVGNAIVSGWTRTQISVHG